MYQIQREKQTRKRRRAAIIAVVGLLLIGAVTGFAYWRQRQEKLRLAQEFTPNPQTELGNESKSDSSTTNSDTQNKVLTQTSPQANPAQSSLPTPQLTKSSGNNGAVPSGAAIEFTCSAPAGYECLLRLKGTKTIELGKKKLAEQQGGTAVAIWDWTAEKGSWSVTAVIVSGASEQASAAQSLAVN